MRTTGTSGTKLANHDPRYRFSGLMMCAGQTVSSIYPAGARPMTFCDAATLARVSACAARLDCTSFAPDNGCKLVSLGE